MSECGVAHARALRLISFAFRSLVRREPISGHGPCGGEEREVVTRTGGPYGACVTTRVTTSLSLPTVTAEVRPRATINRSTWPLIHLPYMGGHER